jgi:hypothetical protein
MMKKHVSEKVELFRNELAYQYEEKVESQFKK